MRLAVGLIVLPGLVGADPAFVDRAADLPVAHIYDGDWTHFVGGGVAVFDCNDDARPDLFAAGGVNPATLLVNKTEGPGAPLSFVSGQLADITGVTGAYPLDIDGDTRLDLAVLRVGPNILLQGQGDCTFQDVTDPWRFDAQDRWSTAFSAIWEGDANWPTLAIGNYVDLTNPDGPFEACDANELHRPDGAGYGALDPLQPGFCALSMLFSDWQRSGTPELRVSNDRHYYVRGGSEQMWQLDPLRLRDETDGWKAVSLWGMGIASADLQGDGFPDVLLTSMGDQLLQFNVGGELRAAPYGIGTYAQRPHLGDDGRPSTGWHAEFGDVDNDGRADLFIAKGNVDQMPSNAIKDPNNLLMQQKDGTFVERSVQAGIARTDRARGAALADLDGDGLLDLVVVNRRAPLELWQNATQGAGNWVALDIRSSGGNTRAVGAWVEVSAGATTWRQEITIGGGHAGGEAGPLHFGIGAATSVSVHILWPDGEETAFSHIPADRRTLLRRE